MFCGRLVLKLIFVLRNQTARFPFRASDNDDQGMWLLLKVVVCGRMGKGQGP